MFGSIKLEKADTQSIKIGVKLTSELPSNSLYPFQ
jgi:hypothetical protein